MIPATIPWRLILALGAILSAFGAGWQVRAWKAGADSYSAVQDAIGQRDKAIAAQGEIATEYETWRATLDRIAPVERETVRQIYETRTVDASCALPDAAHGLLKDATHRANAAATGQSGSAVPDATGSAVD